ncbi:uncharacterized protein LOC129734313 [Falco cherrug]|uniref:uncharacterized protein LOC129734313 n=1 Tax=Falco cherrug TaxID=345164 RepID=UPI00247B0447|nr:uncharacterized protein LOC129734313 [Falco cherrug]
MAELLPDPKIQSWLLLTWCHLVLQRHVLRGKRRLDETLGGARGCQGASPPQWGAPRWGAAWLPTQHPYPQGSASPGGKEPICRAGQGVLERRRGIKGGGEGLWGSPVISGHPGAPPAPQRAVLAAGHPLSGSLPQSQGTVSGVAAVVLLAAHASATLVFVPSPSAAPSLMKSDVAMAPAAVPTFADTLRFASALPRSRCRGLCQEPRPIPQLDDSQLWQQHVPIGMTALGLTLCPSPGPRGHPGIPTGDRASSFSWCNTGGVMDPVSPKVLSLMPSGQTSPGEVLPVSPSLGDHRGCPAQRCFTSLGVSQPVKPLVTGSQAGGFGRRQPLPCRRAGVIPGKHLPWSPVSIWMTFVPSSHLVLLFLGSQRDGRFSPLAGNFNSVIFISPLPSRRGRN